MRLLHYIHHHRNIIIADNENKTFFYEISHFSGTIRILEEKKHELAVYTLINISCQPVYNQSIT